MDLTFTLKNININGSKRGCSGFIRNNANGSVIYVNTEEVFLSSITRYMYRYAYDELDYTGYRNRWAKTLDELASAILDGKTYIDSDDVPDSLKELSNPYDTALRAIKSQQTGDKYRWDVAYFNGHYYVYFGIVPLLLMYLPFRLLTSSPFPTTVGIIIFAILFTIGVYKLITLLAEKKFKNLTVRDVLLIFITTVISCGLIFLVKRPDFYSIPIITGMTFSVFGIYNWVYGLYNEKTSKLRFLVGSLCMALVAGCRPQMLLLTFLAIPLFFKKYLINKEIKTKKRGRPKKIVNS